MDHWIKATATSSRATSAGEEMPRPAAPASMDVVVGSIVEVKVVVVLEREDVRTVDELALVEATMGAVVVIDWLVAVDGRPLEAGPFDTAVGHVGPGTDTGACVSDKSGPRETVWHF